MSRACVVFRQHGEGSSADAGEIAQFPLLRDKSRCGARLASQNRFKFFGGIGRAVTFSCDVMQPTRAPNKCEHLTQILIFQLRDFNDETRIISRGGCSSHLDRRCRQEIEASWVARVDRRSAASLAADPGATFPPGASSSDCRGQQLGIQHGRRRQCRLLRGLHPPSALSRFHHRASTSCSRSSLSPSCPFTSWPAR